MLTVTIAGEFTLQNFGPISEVGKGIPVQGGRLWVPESIAPGRTREQGGSARLRIQKHVRADNISNGNKYFYFLSQTV